MFQLPYEEAVPTLDAWIAWARRCRIPRFVKLRRDRLGHHRDTILASIEHHLSNGLIESVNTRIRLIARMAFGFASPDALIALAMLNLAGHRPVLPGRTGPTDPSGESVFSRRQGVSLQPSLTTLSRSFTSSLPARAARACLQHGDVGDAPPADIKPPPGRWFL